ncbi:RHS repeat-associated core domain-containing protein, partial [Neptuniibacter sp.]|uniref:RHS repeat domain-containing protein n=1 Tax=Neptuniibacter sp. TaxID=1962643 RepID=UPI0026165786
IEEQDNAGATEATYVYGTWIDEVLRMERGVQDVYYHQNALGSVVGLTDGAGNVVERYRYAAYGRVTVTDGNDDPVAENGWGMPHSAYGNPYLFTGRRLDEETGLYYYRARYYAALIGRFLQRDPVGYIDSMNFYMYVFNSPVNYRDSYGLTAILNDYNLDNPFDSNLDNSIRCNEGQCSDEQKDKCKGDCQGSFDEGPVYLSGTCEDNKDEIDKHSRELEKDKKKRGKARNDAHDVCVERDNEECQCCGVSYLMIVTRLDVPPKNPKVCKVTYSLTASGKCKESS